MLHRKFARFVDLPKNLRTTSKLSFGAKITDPDLIDSIELLYQVVSPGQYFGAYRQSLQRHLK